MSGTGETSAAVSVEAPRPPGPLPLRDEVSASVPLQRSDASTPIRPTPGPAIQRITAAAANGPQAAAAALTRELEKALDLDQRVKIIEAAEPQIAGIGAGVKRAGEQELTSILIDLSKSAELAGPLGAQALARAFALDRPDQLGAALIRVLHDGASPDFALELPGALRDLGAAPKESVELTTALARGLRGVPLTPEQSRRQVENLALCPSLNPEMAVLTHAPTQSPPPELLVDGGQAFPRILQDFRDATSSIHITQYGFKDGKLGREVADILMEKARAGVEVRVMVDEGGTQPHRAQKKLYDALVAAGVQVVTNDSVSPNDMDGLEGHKTQPKQLTSDELGAFDHRKLYVIDGKIAYTGGMGIEDHFVDKQHDVMVRLHGPVVQQLQSTFLSGFMFLGGPLPAAAHALDRYYPAPDAEKPDGAKVTVLNDVPKAGYFPIREQYLGQISRATTSLELVNPYFGDDAIVQALCDSARRGVKVTLVLPHDPENALNNAAQRHEYQKLLKAGVDVREYPTMLHAKLMVVDGERVLVGTANLDRLSMHMNWELDVLYEDRRVAEEFHRRIFEVDLPKTAIAQPPSWNPKDGVLAWLSERVVG
jgi:cardiolipin synthase